MKAQPALALILLLQIAGPLQAAAPKTVPVGDAGNAADATGYGAVAYHYRIGKYEVTNAEYCEFLNAVVKSDPHQLYDGRMAGGHGGIVRSGSSGEFEYRTKADEDRKPVSYVTWESCARYANWLSNGGGKGDTETGTYKIVGGSITPTDHAKLAAGKTTKWAIASENEWYKAAYYDPKKEASGGYWLYASPESSAPKCNLNTRTISAVGSYRGAASACGTFDQNGNLWEYNETMSNGKVGLRGGSYYHNDHDAYLRSSTRYEVLSAKWPNYGFRVVALGSGKVRPAAKSPAPAAKLAPARRPTTSRSKATTFYISQSEGNDD